MLNDRQTIHGSLVSVLGRGILLIGESDAGKSKLCFEAIDRGHKLVADDAVELQVVHGHLIGKAPENIAGLIEVKGREIFDVRKAFGNGSFAADSKIDALVELVDECGSGEPGRSSFLNIELMRFTLPPGRASIADLESLAMTIGV